MLLKFLVKTVRDFKDLTVTVESELECEILTTGNARCYLKTVSCRITVFQRQNFTHCTYFIYHFFYIEF